MVAIIDYGMGNLRSVLNAVEHLGGEGRLAATPAELAGTDRLILPGVGAFGDAMANLAERGWVEALGQVAAGGRPVLGVCLGMQLLASRSHEHGEHGGLGLIAGEVRRLAPGGDLRVPHVGWNELTVRRDSPLLAGAEREATFYFVHSFEFVPEDDGHVTGTTAYGGEVIACVEAGRVFGVQFHPEKSQRDGLALLKRFLELAC